MKVLVVGGGSIGARHVRNLVALSAGEVGLVEPDDARRVLVAGETGARQFASLDAGLDWGPSVALVATPTHLHVGPAMACVRRSCHVFIEKPLSHTAEGIDELAAEIGARKLVSLVGCNMRFHPGPAKVKALLDAGAIGRPLYFRVHTGSYLPGWRPSQDYRRSYSANASMGGGALLDCIHEIDLARWYAGEVLDVTAAVDRIGPLEIDVEDYAALLCRHAGGARSEVHLDYLSRTYERGCHVAGETGTIHWDYRAGVVRLYEAGPDRWTEYPQPPDWEPNAMYVDELRHFLACVARNKPAALPVVDAARVLRIALAAKESAATGRAIKLRSE